MLQRQFQLILLSVIVLTATKFGGGDQPVDATVRSAKELVGQFDKGDPGWEIRIQSLVRLARIGPDAVPALVEALKTGSPTTREFAAQALVMFADPAARSVLEKALTDEYSRVRIYAIRALNMLGPLKPAARYEEIAANDPNFFGVRSMADLALHRKDKPNPAAFRQAWSEYELGKIDSTRVGEVAPDFTLDGYSGKTHRLTDFRGKTVVLTYFLFDY